MPNPARWIGCNTKESNHLCCAVLCCAVLCCAMILAVHPSIPPSTPPIQHGRVRDIFAGGPHLAITASATDIALHCAAPCKHKGSGNPIGDGDLVVCYTEAAAAAEAAARVLVQSGLTDPQGCPQLCCSRRWPQTYHSAGRCFNGIRKNSEPFAHTHAHVCTQARTQLGLNQTDQRGGVDG